MTDSAARIAELEAQVAAMKAQAKRKLTVKVSQKGAVSVYGLQRFPVTLYREQWERIFDEAETMRAWMAANASELASK
jgi:hypothetical protein